MKKFLIPTQAIQRNLDAYLDAIDGNFEKMNFDTQEGQHYAQKINALATKINVARGGESMMHMAVGSNATITGLIVNSKGDLNIVVKRETARIAKALPYALFGFNDYAAGYLNTLKNFVPSGVSYTVSADTATGDVLLTFTEGMNSDVIRISLLSGNTNYLAFLNAMTNNYFKSKYTLQTFSDSTYSTPQMSQLINFGEISALGGTSANQLSANARKMTWDFQNDRVNLLYAEQKITPSFAFVQKITNVAAFEIGWNIFMSERSNLNRI